MNEEEEIQNELPTDAESAMRELIGTAPEIPPQDKPEDKPGSETPPTDKPPVEKPAGEPGKEQEVTETPPVDEKPPAEPPIEKPVEDNFDKEIDAEELPQNASRDAKKGFATVKSKAKAEHQARIEAEKRAAKLEADRKAEADRAAELEKKVLTPEQEQEIANLRQFHETFGLEDDPNLSAPFDQRVAAANTSLEGVMKQLGVPEGTIKFVNENGGLYGFRNSNKQMPVPLKDKTGKLVRMTHAQFYETYIEPNLTVDQKDEITDAFAEIRKARREKDQAVQNLKSNRTEYLKKRDESVKAAQEDWVNRIGKHVEIVKGKYGAVAQLQEVLPTDAPEVKASKEKHNAAYQKAEARAIQIMKEVTPENLVEAAMAAGYVDILKDQILELSNTKSQVTAERDDYKKKYEDLKDAGKTAGFRHEAAPITIDNKKFKTAEDAMTALVNEGIES